MFDKITSRIQKLCYGLNSDFVDPVSQIITIQSFAQFWTFAQFRIIQIEEYLILLNESAGEFKLLSEKVHSLTDIFI